MTLTTKKEDKKEDKKEKTEKEKYNEWRRKRIAEMNKTPGAMVDYPPTWEVFQGMQGSMPREEAKGGMINKRAKGGEVKKYNTGGIVKRFKGGLMVKPKAAKRGY